MATSAIYRVKPDMQSLRKTVSIYNNRRPADAHPGPRDRSSVGDKSKR
jgi:hypothetical protein